MSLQLALIKMLELADKHKLNKEIALESIALTISFLKNKFNYTVHIEKRENIKLFYSTLPEDEAKFWMRSLKELENEKQPNMKGCKKIRLPHLSGYDGIWILECEDIKITELSDEMMELIYLTYLFSVTCLFANELERNKKIDSITGLPDISQFEKKIKEKIQKEEEGFLIAVRIVTTLSKPYQENGIDSQLKKLSEVCKRISKDNTYRIAADTLAILGNWNKEVAFTLVQEIMTQIPEITIFLIPYNHLDTETIFRKIQEELGKAEIGKFVIKSSIPKLFVLENHSESEKRT